MYTLLGIAVALGLCLLAARWAVRYALLSKRVRRFVLQKLALRKNRNVQGPGYPVRYVSERGSKTLLRLVPWDASGLLSETSYGFRFVGESADGEPLEMRFPSEEAMVNYQKGSLLWDGGVSWCIIEVNGEKHYFTSDVPEAADEKAIDANTTVIYRNITERYIRSNSK